MPGPEVAKAYVTIIPSLQGAQQTITQELTGASTPAGTKAGTTTGAALLSSMGKSLSSAGTKLTAAVTVPLAGIGTAAFKSASDFETAFAQLTTIADTSTVSVDSLKSGVMDLSSELGISSSEISAAAYSAISAGQDTADALGFVTSAAKLARGGFTDVSTATDVLTTALNAYGLEAEQVSHVSDVLIETQNEGKTTVDELAASIGRVIPTAANVNVGLEDLASQYVALTKNGIGTAEATTYINSMLNELGKTGTTAFDMFAEAAGMTFPEYIAAGHSTTEAMEVLAGACEDAGLTVSDAFGSAEAGKAANVLVQHADDATTALGNMETMAGQTEEAYATMSDTTAVRLEDMKTKLENLAITIGDQLIPILEPFIEKITSGIETLAGKWNALDDSQKNAIITIAGIVAAIGPVLVIGGKILTGISAIIPLISTLSGALGITSGALLGWVAVIAAVIAAGVLLYTHWDEVKAWAINLWEKIKETFENIKTSITEKWTEIKTKVTETVENIKKKLSDTWDNIKTTVTNVWNSIKTFFTTTWDNIKTLTTNAATSVKTKLTDTWTSIQTTVTNVWTAITTFFSNTWAAITTAVTNTWSAIKQFFVDTWASITETVTNVWSAIQQFFVNTWTAITDKVTEVWNAIEQFFADTWDSIAGTVTDAWNSITQFFTDTWTSITGTITEVWNNITQFFFDTWESIKSGVSDKVTEVEEKLSDKWSSIETTATDTWANIKTTIGTTWENIKSTASSAANNVWSTISTAFTGAWNSVSTIFTGIWSSISRALSGAWSSVSTAVYGIWSTISTALTGAWQSVYNVFAGIYNTIHEKIESAREAVNTAIETIKSYFNFEWSLPKLKMPHISITGSFSIIPPSAPSFSISWYKQAATEGALFTTPQIIGVGDAAQPELLIGEEKLKELVGGGEQNITINVYGAKGQDENALADIVARRLESKLNRRKAVFA